MNKNSPLNQRYICPIGADGIQYRTYNITAKRITSGELLK